jgi:VIT1/CCC1 family predicted Fe2+/Mn2+ transporter
MAFDRKAYAPFVLDSIFGMEVGILMNTLLLSAVVASGAKHETIITNGVLLIFAAAFAVIIKKILSDNSTKEYKSGEEVPLSVLMKDRKVILISYFIGVLIPLAPYIFSPNSVAFSASVLMSLLILFLIAFIQAKIAGMNPLKESIAMVLYGGVAVGMGVAVGKMLFGMI